MAAARRDVQKKGEETLKYLEETGRHGIVLAEDTGAFARYGYAVREQAQYNNILGKENHEASLRSEKSAMERLFLWAVLCLRDNVMNRCG